jgi:aromatic-L-amino-acid decarboxylase
MTPEEFRKYGHAVVDWIADYRARVHERPVMAQTGPAEIKARLPNTRASSATSRATARWAASWATT